MYREFTFFDIDLESSSNFICTPTNLYFSESPNPEVFKKYKLRLPQINLQQASSARVMGLPDTQNRVENAFLVTIPDLGGCSIAANHQNPSRYLFTCLRMHAMYRSHDRMSWNTKSEILMCGFDHVLGKDLASPFRSGARGSMGVEFG